MRLNVRLAIRLMKRFDQKLIRNRRGAAAELARRAGVTRTTVCLWMQDKVTSRNIQSHASALGADIRAGRWPTSEIKKETAA